MPKVVTVEYVRVRVRHSRTRAQLTIHRPDCRYARGLLPWAWASGRTVEDLRTRATAGSFRLCGTCLPRETA